MQIELSDEIMIGLRQKAEDIVLRSLVETLKASFNHRQIVEEVRNAAIKEVAHILAEQVRVKYSDEAIQRAMSSVETRINTQIHRRLQQGIIVKFNEEN